ncbi:MAG: metal-dependent hydrolase [Hahellaceae bacterium]|nr:metal-dependent hydrolase [Hahellaceae bacterium]MCP5168355.1 metal-dependent hydrolase [Hahellaceae bacterium]
MKASNTDTPLIQRAVSFDFSGTPLHWIPDDPYSSHFISVIHTLLPAGEFFFCRLYNKALPHIHDARLKNDVRGFIKQEAMHARAHSSGIGGFLDAHNMETASYIKKVEWIFDKPLHDKPFGYQLPKRMEKHWLVLRLGLIAAIEHFTCVLGKYALENPAWDKSQADAVVLDILRWHGAEEIEHRSVAFDVYNHVGGHYLSRFPQIAFVVPILLGLWVMGASHLMQQDPALSNKQPRLRGLFFWREWRRLARKGHLPSLTFLLTEASRYVMPGYDPATEASTEQAQGYLSTSPAARRAAAAA